MFKGLNKDIQNIKRNETLAIKTVSELKTTVGEIISWVDNGEEKINEHEDIANGNYPKWNGEKNNF